MPAILGRQTDTFAPPHISLNNSGIKNNLCIYQTEASRYLTVSLTSLSVTLFCICQIGFHQEVGLNLKVFLFLVGKNKAFSLETHQIQKPVPSLA